MIYTKVGTEICLWARYVWQVSTQSKYAFAFYGRICEVCEKTKNKKKNGKNEEILMKLWAQNYYTRSTELLHYVLYLKAYSLQAL